MVDFLEEFASGNKLNKISEYARCIYPSGVNFSKSSIEPIEKYLFTTRLKIKNISYFNHIGCENAKIPSC